MKAFFLMGLLLAAGAFGADSKSTFKKKDKIEFSSALKLKGQLKKPDLSYIYKRRGLRAEQIVNIPGDFNEEIIAGENQF